ncbi:MAG: hypothetical protein QOH82_1228, partial [Mycobacterium sp.]|nr:hypothetical protein [Mycobacterium sp.]
MTKSTSDAPTLADEAAPVGDRGVEDARLGALVVVMFGLC